MSSSERQTRPLLHAPAPWAALETAAVTRSTTLQHTRVPPRREHLQALANAYRMENKHAQSHERVSIADVTLIHTHTAQRILVE